MIHIRYYNIKILVNGHGRDGMCCGCYTGGIVVIDVFASTLCMYDLRKCDLFVLSWARCNE